MSKIKQNTENINTLVAVQTLTTQITMSVLDVINDEYGDIYRFTSKGQMELTEGGSWLNDQVSNSVQGVLVASDIVKL
jgi:hypothetical protein